MTSMKRQLIFLINSNTVLRDTQQFQWVGRLTACTEFQWVGRLTASKDILTLKAPITTAADDKFCDIFSSFRKQ